MPESRLRENLRYLGYTLAIALAGIVALVLYILLAAVLELLILIAVIAGAAFLVLVAIAAVFYLFISKDRK